MASISSQKRASPNPGLPSQILSACFHKLVQALPVLPPLLFILLTQMSEERPLIDNMD